MINCRPAADMLCKTDQIAVGILDEEFAIACFLHSNPVPALLDRAKQRPLRSRQSFDDRSYVTRLDLEVDAAAKGAIQRARQPFSIDFTQHDLGTLAFQIGK